MRTNEAVRRISEQDFPGTLPLEEQLRFLLRYAVLAPSARNSQPWRFEVDGDTVRLRADPARGHPVADPDQRELYLSLGCALENLLVAAEHFGLGHSVAYFPSAAEAELAAAVRFGPGPTPTPAREGLTPDTLLSRRTAHGRFARRPVGARALRALEAAAREEGVVVGFAETPGRRESAGALYGRAGAKLVDREEYRRELGEVVGRGELGTPWLVSMVGRLALSRAGIARRIERAGAAALRHAPLLALIGARGDDRAAQLRSGQVLERLWLAATAHGLGLQPASATIEVPETRAALARLFALPEGTYAQELVRIGEPAGWRGFRTPRRTAAEVMMT